MSFQTFPSTPFLFPHALRTYCASMWFSLAFVLLHAGCIFASVPSTHSTSSSYPSRHFPSSPPASSSSSTPSSTSLTITTKSFSVLTESAPSVIPVTPYTFVPFPSLSSQPPIPGVYPKTSPKHPPPVENPALVPDFTQAWTRAYKKAKAKVSILIFLVCSTSVTG